MLQTLYFRQELSFLVEELGHLLGGEGAAVPDLAGPDVLDDGSDLGGGGVLELGGLDGGLLVEQLHDDVVLALGEGAGGHVADQPLVALGGLGSLDGEEDGIVVLSRPLATASLAEDGSAKDETLQEDDSSEEAEGGGGGRGDGGGSAGGGGGLQDEGGDGRVHGQSHEGESGADLGVHSVIAVEQLLSHC